MPIENQYPISYSPINPDCTPAFRILFTAHVQPPQKFEAKPHETWHPSTHPKLQFTPKTNTTSHHITPPPFWSGQTCVFSDSPCRATSVSFRSLGPTLRRRRNPGEPGGWRSCVSGKPMAILMLSLTDSQSFATHRARRVRCRQY